MMYNMISIYSHDIILFIIYIRIDTSYFIITCTLLIMCFYYYGGAMLKSLGPRLVLLPGMQLRCKKIITSVCLSNTRGFC